MCTRRGLERADVISLFQKITDFLTFSRRSGYEIKMVYNGNKLVSCYWVYKGPGSSVGIVTGYGLDGPGIESRWGGRDFPHMSKPAPGPTQPPVQGVPGLSRGYTVVWA